MVGGVIIKTIESLISKRNQPPIVKGEVVASREISDWDDPEVARALHDKWLRKIEEGWNKDDIEPCHCVLCDDERKRKAADKIGEVRSKDGIWKKNGYVFKPHVFKPQCIIPEYAFLGAVKPDTSNPHFAKGHFSWVDPVTGGMKFAWMVGTKKDDVFKATYGPKVDYQELIYKQVDELDTLREKMRKMNAPTIATEKYKK